MGNLGPERAGQDLKEGQRSACVVGMIDVMPAVITTRMKRRHAITFDDSDR